MSDLNSNGKEELKELGKEFGLGAGTVRRYASKTKLLYMNLRDLDFNHESALAITVAAIRSGDLDKIS